MSYKCYVCGEPADLISWFDKLVMYPLCPNHQAQAARAIYLHPRYADWKTNCLIADDKDHVYYDLWKEAVPKKIALSVEMAETLFVWLQTKKLEHENPDHADTGM